MAIKYDTDWDDFSWDSPETLGNGFFSHVYQLSDRIGRTYAFHTPSNNIASNKRHTPELWIENKIKAMKISNFVREAIQLPGIYIPKILDVSRNIHGPFSAMELVEFERISKKDKEKRLAQHCNAQKLIHFLNALHQLPIHSFHNDNEYIDFQPMELMNECSLSLMQKDAFENINERTLCHGDFYPRNIEFTGDDICILDWDFSNISPFTFEFRNIQSTKDIDFSISEYNKAPKPNNDLKLKTSHFVFFQLERLQEELLWIERPGNQENQRIKQGVANQLHHSQRLLNHLDEKKAAKQIRSIVLERTKGYKNMPFDSPEV